MLYVQTMVCRKKRAIWYVPLVQRLRKNNQCRYIVYLVGMYIYLADGLLIFHNFDPKTLLVIFLKPCLNMQYLSVFTLICDHFDFFNTALRPKTADLHTNIHIFSLAQ